MLALIIEDNRHLASNIVEYLEAAGIECDWADRGDHGFQLACSQVFDVIVLDLMLPGLDGIEVCRKLREQGVNTPTLMLTARDTLRDKLEGFEVGADDYLVKPFELAELLARLKSLSKRGHSLSSHFEIDNLSVDISACLVNRGKDDIRLNRIAWKILKVLISASPNVVTKAELEQAVWDGEPPDTDALKVHLHSLRQKIDHPYKNKLIHTVRGVGVCLKLDAGAQS